MRQSTGAAISPSPRQENVRQLPVTDLVALQRSMAASASAQMRHNWTRMTLDRITVAEAEIADFCARNGIRRLALFGSVLTNRFSDSSEIDILVEFRPNERVGFFRLAEMEAELSRILGGRRIDLRTPMDLSRHFRDDVLGTAVPVYAEP